jgi:hypothetical protein
MPLTPTPYEGLETKVCGRGVIWVRLWWIHVYAGWGALRVVVS